MSERFSGASYSDSLKGYQNSLNNFPLLEPEEEIALAKQIEAGVYAQALLNGNVPSTARPVWESDILPPSECELELLAEEGLRAKQRLAEGNLRFVVSVALRYAGIVEKQTPFDLVQQGNLGLMRAVEKFDYTKGYRFLTFAEDWITKEVKAALNVGERIIRLPEERAAEVRALLRASRKLLQESGSGAVSIAALAKEMGVEPEKVEAIMELRHDAGSLDLPVGQDGKPLQDFIQMREGKEDTDHILSELWIEAAEVIDPLDLELLLLVEGYTKREYSRSGDEVATRRDVLLAMKGVLGLENFSDTSALRKMNARIKRAQSTLKTNATIERLFNLYKAARRYRVASEL